MNTQTPADTANALPACDRASNITPPLDDRRIGHQRPGDPGKIKRGIELIPAN